MEPGDIRTVPSFDDYTILNRWGLTFLGIWRYEERIYGRLSKLLHRIHVTILFVLMMLLLIPEWLDLYVLWGNIDANAETFVLNVFTTTALVKLWCFHKARDIFEDVLTTMKKNWKITMSDTSAEHENHRTILLDMANKARNYTKRYGILMYSTAVMYFVSPFVGMQVDGRRIRKYPFFGWYYFDRFSNLYYVLCYASQVIIGIVVGTGNYAMDSIFLVAIYHTCAQLRMLQHDLKKLGEKDNCSPEQIIPLILKHQQNIRNSQQLQTMFSGSSMQQLLFSCVIICVLGFKLIIALNDGGYEFFVYIAFMFLALLQIFLYCRPGDELIAQSIAVGNAAYLSLWDSLDPTTIRKVTMMILRCQKPLRIIAGQVYVLSLPNFTMILKTSMSFLSLIRAMYRNSYNVK